MPVLGKNTIFAQVIGINRAMKNFEYRKRKLFRVLLYSYLLLSLSSCNNNGRLSLGIFDDIDLTDSIRPKEFYEGLLEQFCIENYDQLYHDFWGTRKYVEGSLIVDSLHSCGEREVMVYGKHSFDGRFGDRHNGYKFVANIYETKKGSNDYIVTFEKQSKKVISGRSYTESRTKTFHYEK